MNRPLSFLLVAILLNSCASDCVEGTGASISRDLEIAPFTSISVNGSMDVIIEKGEGQHVVVEAPPELIPLISTEVSDGEWSISTSKCWSATSGITVHITTPLLHGIALNGSGSTTAADVFGAGDIELSTAGSGEIVLSNVVAKKITASTDGSGSISIAGTCADLSASLSGSGDLKATKLVTNTADINVQGSGNATITAISTLDAEVNGSGNIRYAGKPEVSSSVNGSGAVIPME